MSLLDPIVAPPLAFLHAHLVAVVWIVAALSVLAGWRLIARGR